MFTKEDLSVMQTFHVDSQNFVGTVNALKPSIRYEQSTKIIEKFLLDLKLSKQATFWLEECNVCASCCAAESVGAVSKVALPVVGDISPITNADLLFDIVYSKGFGAYKADGVCENEVPYNLSRALPMLYNVNTALHEFSSASATWSAMKAELDKARAVVFSFKTDYNTGHFIAGVGYSSATSELYYYDSWKDNKMNKNGGVLESMKVDDLISRLEGRTRYFSVSKA